MPDFEQSPGLTFRQKAMMNCHNNIFHFTTILFLELEPSILVKLIGETIGSVK